MVKFKITEGSRPAQLGVSRGEKVKLLLMAGGILVVGGIILYSLSYSRQKRSEAPGDIPVLADEIPEERPFVPAIDAARVESLVRDAESADRVMLEGEALDELFRYARQMTAGSYRALEAPELDAERIQEIVGAPADHRAEPFFARGWIDSLRTRRQGPAGETQHIGRMVLEDESVAYFATLRMPEDRTVGSYARLDGLFLKVYSEESRQSGEWLEGPLLVGANLVPSWPDEGTVRQLDPNKLVYLTDDSVDGGITRLPFEATWHVMGYARDLDPDEVDWEEAPLLNKAALEDLLAYGVDEYRLKPYRIPVSRLQSVTVKQAGENPARLDKITEGWIGNTTWHNVIYYRGPFEAGHLRGGRDADLVTARGFFLKNLAYEPRDGGMHLAPAFVLTEMDRFVPPDSGAFNHMVWGIAIASVGLLLFFSFLLSRDKRSAMALQERLVARRRARREATA